jgi:hypothetical protein
MTVGRLPNVEGGIQPTLLTTTGDIMYASSASNPARLGIGSSAQVLTVAAGVPSWATPSSGSMTSIASGSLSGASVSLTSIVGTYKDLKLLMIAPTATANFNIQIRINNITSSTQHTAKFSSSSTAVTRDVNQPEIRITPDTLALAGGNYFFDIQFNNYASTNHYKNFTFSGIGNTNTPTDFVIFGVAGVETTAAITSLQMVAESTTFTGGTYILYGVN